MTTSTVSVAIDGASAPGSDAAVRPVTGYLYAKPRSHSAAAPSVVSKTEAFDDSGLCRKPVSKYSGKRCLDLLIILLSVPLTVPVGLMVAACIKLVSPGPVFFVQKRVGQGGRHFWCLKFRTMSANADQSLHLTHSTRFISQDTVMSKLDNRDPRLIPFARVIRATGLDELPQFLNVLRGEMSIIGPRPCTPYEFERYLPWQLERFRALPGISGLWQVSGKNRTTFGEMIRLDIHYVRNISLAMDLRIIARTPAVLLKGSLELFKARTSGLLGKSTPGQAA